MNFFDFFRKAVESAAESQTTVYTAEDVTKDMTAIMLLYLTEMQQCVERKQMSQALVKERQMLESLGLHKTKNIQLIANHEKEIAQYNANVDCFKLMTEAWGLFGNDVMIVRYDQFMQLLEKYNLVCGELSRYTGYIPEKNLQEIARIKGMDVADKFAGEMDKLTRISLTFELDELIKAIRFPYRPKGIDALNAMEIKNVGYYNSPTVSIYDNMRSLGFSFGIRAMDYGDYDDRMRMIIGQQRRRDDMMEEAERKRRAMTPRFFIAAPAQEMEPLDLQTNDALNMNDLKKREKLQEFANIRIQTRDPFFCSCTRYGVLIYSKWGEEAQDEIIKRYQTLSQTINN